MVSVLSGNRNFEGRINPDVKMNYLASPPLVVAYALAGTMDIDLTTEPLGTDSDGKPVYLRDIWPSAKEIEEVIASAIGAEMFSHGLRRRVRRRRAVAVAADPDRRHVRLGRATRPTCASPRTSRAWPPQPTPVTDIAGARVLAKLGDSVTTDHISPAGSIKADSPAGKYLAEHGVDAARLQLVRLPPRQPRGDDPRHVRQHPAAQPAGARASRAASRVNHLTGEQTTIYDASVAYQEAGVPLVILAGKEYGSGSSRDWAAKGTTLLGVRAVIAESLRAHPPLQPDRHGRAAAAVPGRARPPSRSA